MQKQSERIAVGTLGKPAGLEGGVNVRTFRKDDLQWRGFHRVWIGPDAPRAIQRTIASVRFARGGAVVRFAEVTTRDAAEKLKNQFVFVEQTMLGALQRGVYRVDTLIGFVMVDENNTPLGTLKDVLELPGNDIWTMDRAGREVLIPAVKEFVKQVRMEDRTIVVRNVEGLLEL